MAAPSCDDSTFVETWRRLGSTTLVAAELKITARAAQARRLSIAAKLGIDLDTWNDQRMKSPAGLMIANARIEKRIKNGRVIVFSDAHYHPGIVSTAHRGLLWAIKEFQPCLIINNGDTIDGSTISRHPRIGWERRPTMAEELKTVTERLNEIEALRPPGGELIWNRGNHDSRVDSFLAANAPQFEGVPGMSLAQMYPAWRHVWRTDVNPETPAWCIVKHRGKGGIHATRNNVVNSGAVTFVSGHLHQLRISPFRTARSSPAWGVDCGTLADPEGPQFNSYLEDGIVDWGSGFCMLSFVDGRLLTPELFRVVDEGLLEFRGDLLEV